MSTDAGTRDLEALVELFLGEREAAPDLAPEAFARVHPEGGPSLLPALHRSLELLTTLGDTSEDVPERIGSWRVVREIGRGGMGIVYEVERNGERRALKRVTATTLCQPRAMQRFQREAAVLQRLRHPGIVAVHEVGSADGLPFLVMDLVAGDTLAHGGPLSWQRSAEIVRDTARAVTVMHTAGLWHRDLKPENIVLRADGAPIVVDFGLVHDETDATLTGTGDLLGTPRYLAPEQAEGRPADARTDVHALGLILAELLSGEPVRADTPRSDLLEAARRGLPRRRLSTIPGTPTALTKILRTATARQPRHRYPDAAALAADLDRLLDGQPVQAHPPGFLSLTLDSLRFHPRLAGALAGLLLAVAAVGAFMIHAAQAKAQRARAEVRFERAVLLWMEGETDATRAAARATLAEQADHRGAAAMLVLASDEQAPATAASPEPLLRGITARKAGQWATAATAFRQATSADPSCPLARVLLAEAEEKAGNLAEADGELAAASRLLPDSAALAVALGALRLRRGDPRAAAAEYRRACDLQPAQFHPRYQLARCTHTFDAAAALRDVEAAAALLPSGDGTRARILANLHAATLDKLGRSVEAVTILREMAERFPDDARLMFNLAYALDRLGRVREAQPWYERTLAAEPTNQSAALCLVWLLCTATDEDLRDVDRGEQLLLDVLAHDGGASDKVLQMVREFGLRTHRIDRIAATLQTLADRPDTTQQQRTTLLHTRTFLQNATVPSGR